MNAIQELVVTLLAIILILMAVGFGVLITENLIEEYDRVHYQERHCTLDQSALGPTLYCN